MNKIFSFLFVLFISNSIFAAHIIGGDFYVSHIVDNTFEVKLILYRDCAGGGAAFDSSIDITVYEEGTNLIQNALEFNMSLGSQQNIDLGDGCFDPDICLEQGVYTLNVDFPDNPNGYYLTWERCCRNDVIDNINNPGSVGMVFNVTVPDPDIENSTPQFGEYPLDAYFCINGSNNINFSGTDADGDSLVYLLDTPLIGTGTSVTNPTLAGPSGPKPYLMATWAPGFSFANIVGGASAMSIDPQTGNLSASPDLMGRFVFAVKIEEYRDGIKIGEVRREIQFVSFVCPEDAPSEISWEVASPPSFTIQPNKTFCIDVTVEDINFGDTLFLVANSEVIDTSFFPSASFTPVSGNGQVSTEFCWTPDCSSLRTEPYEITLSALSSGCSDTSFTAIEEFEIIVELPEDVDTEFLLPLQNEITYLMNGDEHCFFVQAEDIDCYDTLKLSVDTSQYIFSEAPISGRFDPSPPVIGVAIGEFCWRPQCPDITFDPDEFYELNFIVDAQKCDVLNSFNFPMKIRVVPETDGLITLPNVFTPNEDLLNARFRPFEDTEFCVKNFNVSILNRWGAVVYSSNDKDFKWDGTHEDSGTNVAAGVYYYIIDYEVFGDQYDHSGQVSLMR